MVEETVVTGENHHTNPTSLATFSHALDEILTRAIVYDVIAVVAVLENTITVKEANNEVQFCQ